MESAYPKPQTVQLEGVAYEEHVNRCQEYKKIVSGQERERFALVIDLPPSHSEPHLLRRHLMDCAKQAAPRVLAVMSLDLSAYGPMTARRMLIDVTKCGLAVTTRVPDSETDDLTTFVIHPADERGHEACVRASNGFRPVGIAYAPETRVESLCVLDTLSSPNALGRGADAFPQSAGNPYGFIVVDAGSDPYLMRGKVISALNDLSSNGFGKTKVLMNARGAHSKARAEILDVAAALRFEFSPRIIGLMLGIDDAEASIEDAGRALEEACAALT
ncbi:MAG: hypothetical protein KGI41_02205 [Patescibacteria group bacterium]|nr:hypothetical protein [Patescibacteria group bacterium]MDE1966026.1 hypothetical protein [Patescibacteria group bacterium]